MSDTIIEGTYEQCQNGVAVLSNGSVLTDPFWTIKRAEVKQVDIDRCIELGTLRERQRIEKLLPDIIRLGNIDYLFDIDKEMPELVQEAKALIKGEQK